MLALVQTGQVYDQIFQVVQTAYENVVLTRAEQKRMFFQILRELLDDMIQKLDAHSSAS